METTSNLDKLVYQKPEIELFDAGVIIQANGGAGFDFSSEAS